MNSFNITALGNALVDLEYVVDTDFLSQQGIEKGVMTLIEKDQHLSLLTALNKEHTIRKKACGGSAANTIVTAAQFGANTHYCCKVGNDDFGQFYEQDLTQAKVASGLAQADYHGETGKCIVMITDDADRTMNTYLGITAEFNEEQLDADAIAKSDYLYIEGHLVYSPAAVAAILAAKKIARANDTKVALTVSDPAVIKYVRNHLEEVIGDDGVDLLFCNSEEATDFGKGSLEQGIEDFRKVASHLVVTHGPDGATVYENSNCEGIHIAPHKVDAIDTTGAGDTFAGAYLYGITNGYSCKSAGILANRTAAECVAQYGPRISQEKQQEIQLQLANS